MLKRFAGTVSPSTLYKAYRTAIEPIALYGTEVLYENLSIKVLKSFNRLEFATIKTAYPETLLSLTAFPSSLREE